MSRGDSKGGKPKAPDEEEVDVNCPSNEKRHEKMARSSTDCAKFPQLS